MELIDVVMKLTGPVDPVGECHIDGKRLENLKALCALTEQLFDRIEAIAGASDEHLASVKAAKDVAAALLADARAEPLDLLRRIVAWRDDVHAGRVVRGADLEELIEEARALAGHAVQGEVPRG